jgi:hypothetical protein
MMHLEAKFKNHDLRRNCRKTLNQVFSDTHVVDFTTCEFSKITTFGLFRQSQKESSEKGVWITHTSR